VYYVFTEAEAKESVNSAYNDPWAWDRGCRTWHNGGVGDGSVGLTFVAGPFGRYALVACKRDQYAVIPELGAGYRVMSESPAARVEMVESPASEFLSRCSGAVPLLVVMMVALLACYRVGPGWVELVVFAFLLAQGLVSLLISLSYCHPEMFRQWKANPAYSRSRPR
jgi:hypothetical protein